MIEQCIENWHKCIRGQLPGGLDAILDDDCVFYSPIVFTPQEGKFLTTMYLNAAGATFADGGQGGAEGAVSGSSKFKYIKQVMSGNHAVLEFESEVDGLYVNGIDMITCNDEGKIVEFKVMIRPLKAINLMHQKMRDMIAQMQASS